MLTPVVARCGTEYGSGKFSSHWFQHWPTEVGRQSGRRSLRDEVACSFSRRSILF